MKKLYLRLLAAAGAVLIAGCADSTPEQAMSRAVALAGKGEWKKAGKIADRTAAKYPKLAEAHILRAVTSERLGNRDSALDSARRAVELAPGSFEAQYTLGRLYSADVSRSSEAEQALLRAWKMRRDDPGVKILLCNMAMGANSPRTAGYLSMLSRVPEMKDSAILKNQYAVYYVRQGKYSNAARNFNEAFRAGRNMPGIILNVARFYDGCLKNEKMAARLYQEYLKVAGDHADGRVEAAARLSRLGAK